MEMKNFLTIVLSHFIIVHSAQALMITMPLTKLAAKADYIYVGRIIKVQTFKEQLSANNYGVYTLANLQVLSILKGKNQNVVSIFIIGGVVEGQDFRMSDDPEYFEGERVIVFLKKESDGSIRTLYHSQGKKSFSNLDEEKIYADKIKEILNTKGNPK